MKNDHQWQNRDKINSDQIKPKIKDKKKNLNQNNKFIITDKIKGKKTNPQNETTKSF